MNLLLNFIIDTIFLWLPIVLWFVLRPLFLEFKFQSYRLDKLSFSNYVMLELNLPKEVYRSPEAMEFVIDVLHHLGGGAMSWRSQYWYGAILWPSSLEIISIEGSIYFFIRTPKKLAQLVKTTIYSQFPAVEVNEVDDYTRHVPDYNLNQKDWSLYGVDFELANEDFVPIKTYVDYDMGKSSSSKTKEFEKIDPITPMIEFLSTLGEGEQIWIQYIIRADVFSNWRKRAESFVQNKMNVSSKIKELPPSLLKEIKTQLGELVIGSDGETKDAAADVVRLSQGEQDQIKAIQRGLSKYAFETVIRGIYLARKENENPGVVGFFKGPIFKPFSSLFRNSIKKNSDVGFDWVWEDITKKRDPALKRRFFNDYVNREAFYEPIWKRLNFLWFKAKKPMILNTEELATLFHLPSSGVQTTTLGRIDATKSQPPQDLPI